jgi:3-ketosteroid 9alpha-monooxygenase subunit B
MSVAALGAEPPQAHRDHQFHELTIKRVVKETHETKSFVLDVPAELRTAFRYRAGQFCTFRIPVDNETHLRCYSMSSCPTVDDEFQVTVKRVPGGLVSNWMNEALTPGAAVEVTCPAGVFCPTETDRDLVAFAGGSGITPIFSIVKEVLATTARRIHLLYANRDAEAVIFGRELTRLAEREPDRLRVTSHLDENRGFLDEDEVRRFFEVSPDAEFYLCGPGLFMELVERTLLGQAVLPERIRVERFLPAEPSEPAEPASDTETQVTIELAGRSGVADYRPGTTILQTARQLGMSPPFSCESGSCATCMARLVEGSVRMRENNALTEEEVDEGWILTCQSEPTSTSVHVVYE